MPLISMTSMYSSAINSGGAGVPQEPSFMAKLSVDQGGTPMGVLEAPLTEDMWLAQLSDREPPAIQLSFTQNSH